MGVASLIGYWYFLAKFAIRARPIAGWLPIALLVALITRSIPEVPFRLVNVLSNDFAFHLVLLGILFSAAAQSGTDFTTSSKVALRNYVRKRGCVKLSVITCTWNSLPFLEQSISSVLAQDVSDIEYIFVDGGSDDGTLERIARVPGNVRVLNRIRGGIGRAMNEGVRAATGDIVAHMHADDYFLGTQVFSQVLDVFEQTGCRWLFGRIMSDVKGTLEKERYTVPSYSYGTLLKTQLCSACRHVRLSRCLRRTLGCSTSRIGWPWTTRCGSAWARYILRCSWIGTWPPSGGILAVPPKPTAWARSTKTFGPGSPTRRCRDGRSSSCATLFVAIDCSASYRCEAMARVLLISHGFQPDYEAGFANGLARNGIGVELVSSDRTMVDQLDRSVRTINLRGSQDRSRPAWRKALNLVRYYGALFLLLMRQPKVPLHMIGLFALDQPWTWRWECTVYRLCGRRLIMTVHNITPHGRDTSAVRAGLLRAYRLPHRLVVHTQRAADRLVDEFGIAPERIVVMEHGIDRIPLLSSDRVARERAIRGIGPAERLVVFFGAVLPYKGVDLLLDAATRSGWNARILIAGRCGDSQYGARLREQIAAHPFSNQIVWEDRVFDQSEATSALAVADVVAMPYRHIDQSGVLFAALRHGLPVVGFDVGSLREYVSDEGGASFLLETSMRSRGAYGDRAGESRSARGPGDRTPLSLVSHRSAGTAPCMSVDRIQGIGESAGGVVLPAIAIIGLSIASH